MLAEFFMAFFTALALENIFFTRALDYAGLYKQMQSPKKILMLGGVITGTTGIAAVLTYFVNLALKQQINFVYFGALCYILINIVVYLAAVLLAKQVRGESFATVAQALPFSAINCIVFGTLLIGSRMNEYTHFYKFLGYNLGAGVGFTLALLVLWCVRQKLLLSTVPKTFRGLPITLLYIGLVSLSIFGLVGNQLPS